MCKLPVNRKSGGMFISIVFIVFFAAFFSSVRSVNATLGCGVTGCSEYGEYGCDTGLSCDTGSDTCGIKYNSCSGSTCIQDNEWDITSPCNTADKCTSPGTTRTSIWVYGACSTNCGANSRTGTCTDQAQNNCSVANCTSPAGTPGSTYTDSTSCACVSQVPQTKPVISSVGLGSCSKANPMTVNWSFSDTGTACGKAWGYVCAGNTNTFLIKVDGVDDTADIGSSVRTVTISTPTAASHQIQVCAENGFGENCSNPYTVSIDATAPPAPVPIIEFVSDGTCIGKYQVKYSWNAVSDIGCANMNPSTPYWSQASTGDTFPNNDFPINTWGNYTTQTTGVSYTGGTTLYAHVRSRDALNNQSGWNESKITIPTPTLYPTIAIGGSYVEKITDGGSSSCSTMNINEVDLGLQPVVPSYVTPICTKTSTSYSCNFTIDNQTPANACVSNSVTIGMNGTYSGYSSVNWLSGESCDGSASSFTLSAGDSKSNIPLFFTYDATNQGGWFKISNASFTNRSSATRTNFIPNHIQAFDATDDVTTHNFSIKAAGIISQQTLLNVGANAHRVDGSPNYSIPNIYTNGYTQVNDLDFEKYTQYVKARKGFTTKAALSDITGNGVYLIPSSLVIDASSSALLSDKKVVLVTEGSDTITITSDFNPTNASVAFVAPTVTIDPSVKSINAVLIAGTIQTGDSVNELKITGNIVSQNVMEIGRKRSSPQKPSLFVDFNMKAYIDLLPYLSVSTYDWKQTQ